MHLGQGSTSEAVGADTLQSHTVAGISENLVSTGFMNMPSTMPTGEQVFFLDIRLVSVQVAFKLGVNLDFPGVLLALGVDAADENLVSNSLYPHHITCEQSTSFIDAASRV